LSKEPATTLAVVSLPGPFHPTAVILSEARIPVFVFALPPPPINMRKVFIQFGLGLDCLAKVFI
jgi:hypothetical protein